MKRGLVVSLLFLLLASFVALSNGSMVWVNPQLWDQDANERLPIGPGYPVLAITQVIDGDTFEALLHIAPRLITAVDVRVAFPDKSYVDTPEMSGDYKDKGKEAQEAVLRLLVSAQTIRVTFLSWDKYAGRWDCSVTIDDEIDLATWITENRLTKPAMCPGS